MRVSDEDIARLDAVATHGDSVLRDFEDTNNRPLARVLDELLALRKVADAAKGLEDAMDGVDCHCRGNACEEMCRALREAGR